MFLCLIYSRFHRTSWTRAAEHFTMISTLIFVVGLTAVSAQVGSTDWYCGMVAGEDCSQQGHRPKCGTNGITYDNMCYIGKAHCNDKTVDQRHEGPCGSTEQNGTTSTLSPQQIIAGSQIILDFQCSLLSHRACTHSINEKICGTDGVTYEDFCEYEKARCTHRDLHVQKLGDCTA